jgi:gamma-glutamyl:cysteine ligase YbdK (ATP-grasp superfamily)
LFEAFGVELEYMVVHKRTLNVMTAADELLRKAGAADDYVSDISMGEISASNEMPAHLIELKTTEPTPTLVGAAEQFQRRVTKLNGLLGPLGGQLLPTAMHPWMDPLNETKIWPHDYNREYTLLNRIFNAQGHGWSNVQSVHLNLPFGDDTEFARLHTAVRLILPLLPALAASSPVVENRFTGALDARMTMYPTISRRIPSITGAVIPELVYSEQEYRDRILQPMYADVAPFDREGILQREWLNARGAIARFERRAIEIRVIDVQECPAADLAILGAITGVLKRLVAELGPVAADGSTTGKIEVERLSKILTATTRDADEAIIDDTEYLRLFGLPGDGPRSAGDLWRHLVAELRRTAPPAEVAEFDEAWTVLVEQGPLARRILRAWDAHRSHGRLSEIYRELGECLAEGRLFRTTT